jgi:hypothetical protein
MNSFLKSIHPIRARVAQSVEHRAYTSAVLGSIPSTRTNKKASLDKKTFLFNITPDLPFNIPFQGFQF